MIHVIFPEAIKFNMKLILSGHIERVYNVCKIHWNITHMYFGFLFEYNPNPTFIENDELFYKFCFFDGLDLYGK